MNARVLNLISIVLSAVGIFIAGVLTYYHLKGVVPPCGSNAAGCASVQSHPSSAWFGIPVAAFGLVGYILMAALGAGRVVAPKPKFNQLTLFGFLLSTIGLIVSIALIIYAETVIKATCSWCMASAGTMAASFVIHGALMQKRSVDIAEDAVVGGKKLDLGLIGIVLVGTIGAIAFAAISSTAGRNEVIASDKFGGQDPKVYLSAGAPTRGSETAPITIVEFADVFCGACRRSWNQVKRIYAEHPEKVRIVFRHFPLHQMPGHELSLPTAIGTAVAQEQGKFWDVLSTIFEADLEQIKTMDGLYTIFESYNVRRADIEKAIADTESPAFQRVYEDLEMANKLGLTQTPTFLMIIGDDAPIALDSAGLDRKMKEPKIVDILRS